MLGLEMANLALSSPEPPVRPSPGCLGRVGSTQSGWIQGVLPCRALREGDSHGKPGTG